MGSRKIVLMFHLQASKGDTDTLDTVGEGEMG